MLPLLLSLALTGCKNRVADPADLVDAECAADGYPEARLRLLTRAEYDRTVADLFPALSGGACSDDLDCDVLTQSCVAGSCSNDPCELVTFHLDAPDGPYGSVHVAGTFNGWAPTVADGGWAMEWVAEQSRYVAKRAVPDGNHEYKFVIDEWDWRNDPANPDTAADGYGGWNSLLAQDCEGATGVAEAITEWSAGFPVESRPEHYPFDNSADSGLVTTVHVEQYLAAAEAIAEQALTRPDTLYTCSPGADGCARELVTDLGRRAFRRPLTAEEADRYEGLVEAQADWDTGVAVAVRVMLSSPYFLYRFEVGQIDAAGQRTLTDFEIASALSYLVWGTMPDEALLDAAASGTLSDPAELETQARRLLADPRAREIVGRFGLQWLGVEGVTTLDKVDPAATDTLRNQALAETAALMERAVFESDYRTLYTGKTAAIGDELAALYGVEAGADVALPTGRAGILGQASVAMATSHSDQTSPIRRGLFVRERLLCQDLGTPPANAGGVPEVDPDATTRERFAQHTDDPACASCHQYIDGLGFGFENLDPVGRWRETDAGVPVDASGELLGLEQPGGTDLHTFVGVVELGRILADSDSARHCFTTQWHRYATGRLETDADACTIAVVDDVFAQSDGSVEELLVALVTAPRFVRRTP